MSKIRATVEVEVSEAVKGLSNEEIAEAIEGQGANFVVNSRTVTGICVDVTWESHRSRCWSCQAFLSVDSQDENGYYCPNCGDDPHAVELEANGFEYDGTRWKRGQSNE